VTSRFLTVAAIAGMLLAAGCGGGAGTSTGSLGSLTPATPSTGTGTTSHATGTVSAQFLIPSAAIGSSSSASASSRSPQYISPGTTGIQLLLGNGTVAGGAGATGNAQLFQNFGGAGGSTYAVGAGASTVQLVPGSFNATPAVNQAITFLNIGSIVQNATAAGYCNGAVGAVAGNNGSLFAAANGTYQICTGLNTGAQVTFTVTSVNANGSVLNGTVAPALNLNGFNVITSANTLVQFAGPNGVGQTPVLGTLSTPLAITANGASVPIPSSVYGANPGSTATLTFATSVQGGYTVANITLSNLTAQANYAIGVVLTDTANNNFVLSEGQVAGITVAASGPTVANLTLLPVVNSFVMPAANIVNNQVSDSYAGLGIVGTNTYETTLFAADERGFIIPQQLAGTLATVNTTPDNLPAAAMLSIAGTNLLFASWTDAVGGATTAGAPAVNAFGLTNTPLTEPPGVGPAPTVAAVNPITVGGTGAVGNALGNYFKIGLPTALGLAGVNITASATAFVAAGNPLNIQCNTATVNTTITGTMTSRNNNTVTGYTYTPGTNFPANTSTINLGTVNCAPGITTNLN